MSTRFTKSVARNMFYGGSVFFILMFLALTFHTTRALPERDNREAITPEVALGKKLWEDHNCIGCHTLLGEGAYFAPEVGNVWVRYGGRDDPESAREAIRTSVPPGTEELNLSAFDRGLEALRPVAAEVGA